MKRTGTHPKISKEEAKKQLSPGACKYCIHIYRAYLKKNLLCSRCMTYNYNKWVKEFINEKPNINT